jgi:hypothetical protein
MARTVGVRASLRYATTSLAGISPMSPPISSDSTALDGTAGSRPTARYRIMNPASDTTIAAASSATMMATGRRLMDRV